MQCAQESWQRYGQQQFVNVQRCDGLQRYFFSLSLSHEVREQILSSSAFLQFKENNVFCVPMELSVLNWQRNDDGSVHVFLLFFTYAPPIRNPIPGCNDILIAFPAIAFAIEHFPVDFQPQQYIDSLLPLTLPQEASVNTTITAWIETNDPNPFARKKTIRSRSQPDGYNDVYRYVGCRKLLETGVQFPTVTFAPVINAFTSQSRNVELWLQQPLPYCPTTKNIFLDNISP